MVSHRKYITNSRRFYIHHDIYDTPLVDRKDENNLNGDIEIIFTGLSSVEKLHEELSETGKFLKTKHPSIKKIKENKILEKDKKILERDLNNLTKTINHNDYVEMQKIIKKMLLEYRKN